MPEGRASTESEGRGCFVCGRPQRDHPGGIECEGTTGREPRPLDRESVEVSHSSIYAAMDRSRVERMIAGALASAIDAHGPLTRRDVGSATKRIVGQLLTPDGRTGCPYCRERLRVNVALLMENKELRGVVKSHRAESSSPDREGENRG